MGFSSGWQGGKRSKTCPYLAKRLYFNN
jgi:hypothetical protein